MLSAILVCKEGLGFARIALAKDGYGISKTNEGWDDYSDGYGLGDSLP